MLCSSWSPVSSRGIAAPKPPKWERAYNLTGRTELRCSLDDSAAAHSGIDQLRDLLDPANAHVFTVVSEHSLVTEFVEDRTHNRSPRSHEVGQLLLCEANVLSEAMLAASGRSEER